MARHGKQTQDALRVFLSKVGQLTGGSKAVELTPL